MLAGTLKKERAAVHNEFAGIDRDVKRTQQGLTELSSREYKLKVDRSGIQQANRDLDNLQQRMNNGGGRTGFGGIFAGSMLGTMAASAFGRMTNRVMGFGTDVLQSGMQQGANKMQFQVLAGDKEGSQLYKDLQKYVRDSIFGPELYDNAKQMMAFGIAAKDVMPTMKMLGDVSMGDAQRLNQLTLAFSQTTSAGKLMGQDLLQYVAAGFNPLQEISKKTGRSMADLREDMSKGAISAQMVRDAFAAATGAGGKFNGMLDKMGKTPFGKWQAITGSWADAKAQLGSSQDQSLSKIFDHLKDFVDSLPKMVERMAPAVEKILMTADEMIPSIKDFGAGMVDLLKPIGGLLLSDNFKRLAKDVMDFATAIEKTLLPVVEILAKGAEGLAGGVNWLKGKDKDTFNDPSAVFFKQANIDSMAKAGYAVDDSMKAAIKDSVVNGKMFIGGNISVFNQRKDIDSFNRAMFGTGGKQINSILGGIDLPFKKVAPDSTGATTGTATPTMSTANDTVSSGGAKQITIHIESFAREFKVVANNVQDGAREAKEVFERMFLEVVQSANAAM